MILSIAMLVTLFVLLMCIMIMIHGLRDAMIIGVVVASMLFSVGLFVEGVYWLIVG